MTGSQNDGATFGAALGRRLISKLNGAEDIHTFDWRRAASDMARELRDAEDGLRRSGVAEADVERFGNAAGREVTKTFAAFRSGVAAETTGRL